MDFLKKTEESPLPPEGSWALASWAPFTNLVKSYSAFHSRSFMTRSLPTLPWPLLLLPPPYSSHIRLLAFLSMCHTPPCLLLLLDPEPFFARAVSSAWNALCFSSWWDPTYPSRPSSNNPLSWESFPDLFKQCLVASSALYILSYNILHCYIS